MSALTQMEQLAAFADFEERYNPHPEGHKHIATWAMEEIYRLQALLLTDADLEAIRQASVQLDNFVTHLDEPIVIEMVEALAAALRSITDERKV